MQLEIKDNEKPIVKHAIETYLSNLRSEIVKTEKHDWKVDLHTEKEVLKELLAKLN